MDLSEGTSALITGGGSGLGAATARRLVERGVAVLLADLPDSPAADLAEELTAAGRRARAQPTDVRDVEQVHAAVQAAGDLGDLRVLVCCAGVATPGRILGKRGPLDLETAHRVVQINLLGTMNAIAAAAPVMSGLNPVGDDGERGVIVMTASVAAQDGQIGQLAYAASKAGVAGMTLPAARDLASHGVRVMTIAPGVFNTAMMAGMADEVRESLEALVPHPSRLGHPHEYADLVAHIVANPMLNGEVIRLDGALRMPPR
ncbi:SDR family NAD(P)-dependent oxidoreductase [Pseudactinotalea sp. Z1732]|uniref:SDR family NAD(P)-dependent oxidoreductase n=1 Tax=Micrococcales TaxID=85006 RepID=UPI003C7A3A91